MNTAVWITSGLVGIVLFISSDLSLGEFFGSAFVGVILGTVICWWIGRKVKLHEHVH